MPLHPQADDASSADQPDQRLPRCDRDCPLRHRQQACRSVHRAVDRCERPPRSDRQELRQCQSLCAADIRRRQGRTTESNEQKSALSRAVRRRQARRSAVPTHRTAHKIDARTRAVRWPQHESTNSLSACRSHAHRASCNGRRPTTCPLRRSERRKWSELQAHRDCECHTLAATHVISSGLHGTMQRRRLCRRLNTGPVYQGRRPIVPPRPTRCRSSPQQRYESMAAERCPNRDAQCQGRRHVAAH